MWNYLNVPRWGLSIVVISNEDWVKSSQWNRCLPDQLRKNGNELASVVKCSYIWIRCETQFKLNKITGSSTETLPSLRMVENEKPWPEPAPDWPKAKEAWKWGWPFHVYFFAVLYCLVIIRGLFVLIRHGKAHSWRKNHRFLLNLLLLAFGTTRALFLIWDPYGSNPNHTKTELIIYITTFGVGTACITSAFSFLLLIVLESTRISVAPSKFQNRTFLLGVLTVNVLYVVVSDLIVAHFQEAMVMILICQITFALWGFLIALGYAFAAVRLWRNLRASRQTAQYDPGLAAEGKKITRLVSLLYSASICGVVLFSTIVYTALGETGVYNESGEVSNWPWFAVQTLLRTCEVFTCLIIFLIALKTSTAHSTNNNRVDSVSKVTT